MGRYGVMMGLMALGILVTGGLPLPARADDPACMRVDCLGKCASREEMKNGTKDRAIPMLCMAASECYSRMECTKLEDGKCGWKKTAGLDECLAKYNAPLMPER